MSQENKERGLADSQRDDAWHLKEKRSLNSVQCDKHKLQKSESKRNPDRIKQSEECDDDRKINTDKDVDKQPVEESRKKESKFTPLMKIEEKFSGRYFCLQAGYI